MDQGEAMAEDISDMESKLLAQFECMGTTDKDVLIAEFQRLLGPNQLSPEGCAFFLEMSSWNLQQAICAYFDFDAPKDVLNQSLLPLMTFVSDVTIGDGEEVPPNTNFTKTWRIQNSGPDRWPAGCTLRFVSGDQLTHHERVIVEALEPGHISNVSVDMRSPSKSGNYQSQWRMATATGQFFGEMIWVIISVAEGGLLGLTQAMDSFHSLGSPVAHGIATASLSPINGFTHPAAIPTGFSNPFGTHPGSPQPSSLLLNTLRPTINGDHNALNSANWTSPMASGDRFSNSDGNHVNPHIDRLKSTPTDDNSENCFRVCNNILTRSPGSGQQLVNQVAGAANGQLGNQDVNPVPSANNGQFPPTPPPSEDMLL